jgi:hypothetical protein
MRTMQAAGACLLLTMAAACSQAATPTGVYTAYRKAFDQAKTVDELAPYMDQGTLARVAAAPAKEKQGFFLMMKAMTEIVDLKVVKETVTGQEAVVEAKGLNVAMGRDSRATVQLVKENGAWKIKNESWKEDETGWVSGPTRRAPCATPSEKPTLA